MTSGWIHIVGRLDLDEAMKAVERDTLETVRINVLLLEADSRALMLPMEWLKRMGCPKTREPSVMSTETINYTPISM